MSQLHAPTSSITEQALGEGAGELRLPPQEQILETDDVVERFTARELPSGIDLGTGALAADPVVLPPRADRVEVLEGEAGGIDALVALVASRRVTVFREELADRRRAAYVGIDCRDIVRWW